MNSQYRQEGPSRFWEDFIESRLDEAGNLDEDLEKRVFKGRRPKPGIPAGGPVVQLHRWLPIGPTNLGGRVKCIVFNPQDPKIVYAGSAQGGVLKSVNGGKSWKLLMSEEPSLAISALAVDPSQPNTVYAGTGEYGWLHHRIHGKVISGAGILKSLDGGMTWAQLTGTLNRQYSKILVHPTDSGIIYAAGLDCLERSLDGGETWKAISLQGMSPDTGGVSDIVFDPSNPGNLYAGHEISYGVQKTSNAEAPTVIWASMNAGLPLLPNGSLTRNYIKFSATVDSQGKTTIWCQKNVDDDSHVGIFHWNGTSWIEKFRSSDEGTSGQDFSSAIAAQPGNPTILLSGYNKSVWTRDGGSNWHDLEGGHDDYHAFVFDPADSDRVLVGNDGGIYVLTLNSLGIECQDANEGNNTILFTHNVSVSDLGKVRVGAATQDQGVLVNLADARSVWEQLEASVEWGPIQVHPKDGAKIVWDPAATHLRKSIDGGKTSWNATNGIGPRETDSIALHPSDSQIILAGARSEELLAPGLIWLPAATLNGLQDFTIALWFQIPESKGREMAIISGASQNEANEILLFKTADERLQTRLRAKTQDHGIVSGVGDGNWHHIAWTRSGKKESLYVDGRFIDTKTVADRKLQIDENGLVLGQEQGEFRGKFRSNHAFVGKMADLYIFESTLEYKELRSLFGSADQDLFEVLRRHSCRAHYSFDGHVQDVSGNGLHGTAECITFSSGKYTDTKPGNQAACFCGTLLMLPSIMRSEDGASLRAGGGFKRAFGHGAIGIPSDAINGLNDFTLSLWVRPVRQDGHPYTIISGVSAPQQIVYQLRCDKNGKWYGKIGTTGETTLGVKRLQREHWHHIVWTRKASQMELYLDGVPVASSPVNVSNAVLDLALNGLILGHSHSQGNQIGRDFQAGKAFIGYMADFQVYARSLGSSEAVWLFDHPYEHVANLNPQIYYPFDGHANDISGNNRHIVAHDLVYVPAMLGRRAIFLQGETENKRSRVEDITFSPSDPLVAYAVFGSGRVWRSSDGGITWDYASEGPIPSMEIASVTVDWEHSYVVYVTYTRDTNGPRVWKSNDGGGTWHAISANLPDVPIRRLVIDPLTGDFFVAADRCVFRNSGVVMRWSRFDLGLPNVYITDIAVAPMSRRLYLTTHGRGAYWYPLE